MVTPGSVEELQDFVRESGSVTVSGAWPHSTVLNPTLSLAGLTGITELQASDQVVTVRAGTTLAELNLALAGHHLELPLRGPEYLAGFPDTLAAMLSYNLPHAHEARWGNWPEWILGMTVVLADGMLAKSGSRVTKSVAGYDNHKLITGSQFSLAIPVDLNLRVTPSRAVAEPEFDLGSDALPTHVLRVQCSDYDRALVDELVCAGLRNTSTLWLSEAPRGVYSHAWSKRLDEPIPRPQSLFHDKAAQVFDPTGKFRPL